MMTMAKNKRVPFALFIFIFIMCGSISFVHSAGKYSAQMNHQPDLAKNERHFRMHKVNILWEKAEKRLAPEKLKNLYLDLKIQDKDEMTLKQLKGAGGDKDGFKEAELRKTFRAIMDKYGLADHLEHVLEAERSKGVDSRHNEASDEKIAKHLFKDKRLNKLWEKAQRTGFSEEELKALTEEFNHHQEKVDEYSELMDEVSRKANDENILDNSLNQFESDIESQNGPKPRNFKVANQMLKEKHVEVGEGYKRLEKLSSGGVEKHGFDEIRVGQLWQLAVKSKFSSEELESLKEELQHYEHRIRKLKHLQMQVDLNGINEDKWLSKHNPEEREYLEKRVKQYEHKVQKLHSDFESRIMQRHIEL